MDPSLTLRTLDSLVNPFLETVRRTCEFLARAVYLVPTFYFMFPSVCSFRIKLKSKFFNFSEKHFLILRYYLLTYLFYLLPFVIQSSEEILGTL